MTSRVKVFFSVIAMAVSGLFLLVHGVGASGREAPVLPLEKEIARIGFGSGAFQWGEQPIWRAAGASKLDLFIFNGDAIYADFDGEKVFDVTEDILKAQWARFAAVPNFQWFRSRVPIMATWDNHDYGKHDGGAAFPLKGISKQLFLDFFGEPEGSRRRLSPGVYDAKTIGPVGRRVQVILLDNRYFKSPYVLAGLPPEERKALNLSGSMGKYLPNTEPGATLLGAAQWQWLKEQLKKPSELRFIVSGTQIIPDGKGMEEWGNFPRERKRLFDLIQAMGTKGVYFLTGNVHFSEVSRVFIGATPLYEFTASGLDHTNEKYANAKNTYRVAGPYVEHNFGLVEIDWTSAPSPSVVFKVIGLDGAVAFAYTPEEEAVQ